MTQELKKFMIFQKQQIVFQVEYKGGVCYFLWKNYKGQTRVVNYKNSKPISDLTRDLKLNDKDIFIRYNNAINILKKIQIKNEDSFDKIVSSRKPFGLPTNYTGYNLSKSEKFNIKLFRFGKEGYINSNQAEINRHLINKFKVFVQKLVQVVTIILTK